METKALKTGILLASIAIAAGLSAQNASDKQTKTCIKIHENINGKEINIDTCFTGMSADIEKRLAAMGVNDMPDVDNMNGSVNMVVNDDADDGGKGNGGKTEVIVIKHGGDDKSSNDKNETVNMTSAKSGKTYAYTYTISNDSNMIIDDGKDGGSAVTVKNPNGNVTIVTSCSTKNKKVYLFKNVIIKNITDSDKKILPDDASSNETGFSDLNMYPNPSEGNIAITYTSGSDEPLQITVYDINGKKLETETLNNMKGQVSKTISLNSYGQGIYFVHLTQGKQSETRKIIVK